MKKLFCLVLALAMLLSGSALALNYTGNLGNEATFETYTEVRESAPPAMVPVSMAQIFGAGTPYIAHPIMDDYPGDFTYIYRSPDMYGYNAATRINTNLVVYVDRQFASKDEAKAYLNELGLIDIIDEAKGSIVLVTPSSEAGFTAADQLNYYKLQTAMFSINPSGTTADGQRVMYVDAAYYGGYGYYYVIGIDGGATFLNNYVANTFDYVTRIAGMLLVNGKMDRVRDVADFVPVYLVNAPQDVVAKYEKVNGVDFIRREGDKTIKYNHEFPVRKVVTLDTEEVDLPALVHDAYYNLFIHAQRGQEITQGLYTASTPYQGSSADCAPYSLSVRNPMLNGRTPDGICLVTHVEDRFADIQTANGEYLQTWYEYLPEEVLNGTAPAGTVPMILAWHGGGDDPRQFVEGQGLLELAGKERIVILAPEKEKIQPYFGTDVMTCQVAPLLLKYMLETYPAIDPSRIYVTGFSMGGLSTLQSMYAAPQMFAAAFPQSGIRGGLPNEEEASHFEGLQLPVFVSTSEYNMGYYATLGDNENFYAFVSGMLELNHMDPLPEPDFDAYPIAGFKADIYTEEIMNDDYTRYTWTICNDDGIPLVGVAYITSINHALYPQHAQMLWDFFKHYSRNQETLEIEYDPYVR